MIRRPPRSTLMRSSAASDVYKRQALSFLCSTELGMGGGVLPKLLHPVCWPSENLAASPGRHRRRQVVHALFPSSPSALPSSSLALTLFFLCSPRLSSSSSLFRPQIASFLLRTSNPPQPWVNHLASYPYNPSNPSLDTHFAGNRSFSGRRPLVTPRSTPLSNSHPRPSFSSSSSSNQA